MHQAAHYPACLGCMHAGKGLWADGVRADSLFEEVPPAAILDVRSSEDGTRDFLIQWPDGSEDSWVNEKDVAEDVVEDYDKGLEYAEADCILEMKKKGDARRYQIRCGCGCATG